MSDDEIRIESLRAFAARTEEPRFREDPGLIPSEWLDELDALWNGRAVLVLPDGSRWVSSRSLVDIREETGDDVLGRYLMEHHVLRQHSPSGTPEAYLPIDGNDRHRHAFCVECLQLVDLEDEWIEAEATLGPWNDEEEIEE